MVPPIIARDPNPTICADFAFSSRFRSPSQPSSGKHLDIADCIRVAALVLRRGTRGAELTPSRRATESLGRDCDTSIAPRFR